MVVIHREKKLAEIRVGLIGMARVVVRARDQHIMRSGSVQYMNGSGSWRSRHEPGQRNNERQAKLIPS